MRDFVSNSLAKLRIIGIWVKADKMDNKFSMIKDHVTLWRTFGKYRTVIPTREKWYKDWSNWLRKGQVWFTDGACNQQGLVVFVVFVALVVLVDLRKLV